MTLTSRSLSFPSLSIFGRVLSGMKVVERLGAVAVDADDRYVSQLHIWHELTEPCIVVCLRRPREDIKIVKSRVVDL